MAPSTGRDTISAIDHLLLGFDATPAAWDALDRVAGLAVIFRSRVYPGRLPDGLPRELHAVALLYVVSVTGGALRDEPDGSTDRAAWLTRAELADARLVRMLRESVGIAFGEQG